MRHNNRDAAAGVDPAELHHLIPQWDTMLQRLDRVHEQLRSLNGVHAQGAVPRHIAASASMRLAMSPGQLAGFAFRETSGAAPATIVLRDGADASGDVMVPITLAAGGTAREWLLPHGIAFARGLFADVTGAVDGAAFLGAFA